MPTPDESKILKIVEAEGGECTVGRIAAKMRLDPGYVRIILRSMGAADIINYCRSGKVTLAGKGGVTLGKEPQPAADGMKRYLEDRAKWNTF
jgi:Mn-dependent DtxR family transcriptional regulator